MEAVVCLVRMVGRSVQLPVNTDCSSRRLTTSSLRFELLFFLWAGCVSVLVPGATRTGARIHWGNTKPQHGRHTAANVRSWTQTYCLKNIAKRQSTYTEYLINQTKKWMQSAETPFSSWHVFNWKETECFWERTMNKARRHKTNCSWTSL